MKKNNYFAKASFFTLLFLVLLFSCEVGLGSAVDTQPPSVAISYPPSLSVIKDSFLLSGTWNDDRNIEGIFVEVYQIKDDQKTIVFKDQAETTDKINTEEEKQDGTWSIILNKFNAENPEWYNGWEFSDGDYEIQVYAKDKAGQVSSIASRTVSVDNTAPILLLTNPTSAGNDSSPATFGQIVQLTGAFYDFCGKISNLTVSFFNENGEAICDSTFSNITSMSDSSPLTIARYFSSEEDRTANKNIFDNYVKLFGAENLAKFENKENTDNAKIYFTVTASDNAKVYKTLNDNGIGEGNSTQHFYRGTTSMQNLVSGDGEIEDFTLADFAMFLNGTSKQFANYSSIINNIEVAARGLSVTTASNNDISQYISNTDSRNGDPVYLTFVLNPKNNPLYTVGGYEKIATPINQLEKENYSDEGFKYIYTGTPIPMSINVGADNKNLSTHTVSIFKLDRTNLVKAGITGEINQSNFATIFKEENNDKLFSLMWTWNSEILETFNEWGIDKSSYYTPTEDDSNSASISKQFVIDSFEAQHNYEFLVLGQDITGNNIISTITKGYGFCGKVSETVPKVYVDDGYAQNTIVNENKLKGTGVTRQQDVLFLSGRIITDKVLFGESGFNYKATIVDSSDSTKKKILEKNIQVQSLNGAPDYSADYLSNYCYTTSRETPFEYHWRFTTEEFAQDADVLALIANDGSYEITLDITAKNSETSATTITRIYTLDNMAPVPELSEIDVSVEKKLNDNDSVYWINPKNTLTIKGLVTDNLSTSKSCKTWVKVVGLSDKNTEIASGSTWNNEATFVTGVNKWTFTIPVAAFDATKYGANLYIYSQDVAGNVNVAEAIPLWFDTQAPKAKHVVDTKLKDLYFRVGEQDRDDFVRTKNDGTVEGTNGIAFDSNLDKNVGGKYSDGTYGNASTITMRGNFEDSASGVKMIYYKVYPGTANDPTSITDLEALKTTVMTSPTGKFAPLAEDAENKTKRVFYNDKSGNGTLSGQLSASDVHAVTEDGVVKKYWTTVVSNFMTTISGFATGENYIVIVAEDYVGNTAVDAQTVSGTLYNNFKVNVDNDVPTVTTGEEFSKSQYYKPGTGGSFVIYGVAEDAAAGIRSLVVKANGKEITKDITDYGTITTISSGKVVEETNDQGTKVYNIYGLNEDGTADTTKLLLANVNKEYKDSVFTDNKVFWQTVLKDDIFKEGNNYIANGKSISAQVIVADNAGTGNTETYSVANITIDSQAPTITIKSPKNEEEVNQTITISFVNSDGNGSGIDETAAAKPKLYYSEDTTITASSTWTELDQLNPVETDDGGWNFTLDTTQFTTASKDITIKISSQDNVGNVGYSDPLILKINQDSDRPIIKLSNFVISGNGTLMTADAPVWYNRSEIYGTVTDDDGEVLSIKAISKAVTSGGQTTDPTDEEWEAAGELNDNGSWTFQIGDGSQKIYFRIVDAKGKDFISNIASTTTATYGPKLIDKLNNKTGYASTAQNDPGTPDDIIYTKVDTCDPVLDDLYYYACSATVANVDDISDSDWTQVEGIISEKFGGSLKRYLYLKYKASDTNGIYEINPRIKDSDANVTDEGVSPTHVEEISQDDEALECVAYFDLNDGNNPISSGTKTLSINIKDNASINGNGIFKESKLQIDNDAPSISFSNYESGAQVYGSSSVTLRGTTVDDNKVNKVEYILKDSATEPDANDAWTVITKDETVNQHSYTSALGWQMLFDNKLDVDDSSSYHAEFLKETLFRLYNVASSAQAAYDENQYIYVWIRATDELGNSTTNKFYFDVIPNGDRPSIEISYPAIDSSAGGTLRITGSTDIQDPSATVTAVYLQIDPNYNGTEFSSTWYTDLQIIMNAAGVSESSYSISDAPGVIGHGIPITGSRTNWHLTVNANKEFNNSIETDNEGKPIYRTLGIRAYAVSSSNPPKISVTPIHVCKIDPDAPTFENLRFVQYDEDGNETASRKYESGINLKGMWYLVGSIEDDSGIKLVTYNSTNLVAGGEILSAGNDLVTGYTVNGKKNFTLKIPVGNNTLDLFGEQKHEISVTDASENNADATLEFTINFDNKAPVFDVLTGNGKLLSEEENRIIRQSNGKYSVVGSFEEKSIGGNKQSGFGRIAMFFTRRRGDKLCLLDPVVDCGANGTANFIELGTYSGEDLTLNTGIVLGEEGLYWRTAEATKASEVVLTVSSVPANVRVGGLCMVDNVAYRIKTINGTEITLEGSLTEFDSTKAENPDSTKVVKFAIAQIIDSSKGETLNVSRNIQSGELIYNIFNDDGDGFADDINMSGGEGTWTVQLNSSNMLDGKIDMSFVAFDAAGNTTSKTIEQKIYNNPPRIAGVKFGADKNLDGNVTDGSNNTPNEMIVGFHKFKDIALSTGTLGGSYNGQDGDGNWITDYDEPFENANERLVIKGAVKVIPEIVGGNGGLGYTYTYKNDSGTSQTTNVKDFNVGFSSDGSIRNNLTINISLTDFLSKNLGEGNQDMIFTVWDKTDGYTWDNNTNPGSESAKITIPVTVMINDDKAPDVNITPLYWNSAEKNSLYKNSPNNGHIELKNDLPSGEGKFNADGNGVYDRDDKVSGMITFEGKVTDNVVVNKIEVTITGYNLKNDEAKAFTIAERGSNGWESAKLNASLTEGADWSFEFAKDENGNDKDTYDSEGKNTVEFKFHFNTEKISTVAASNVTVSFEAYDKGSPSLSDDDEPEVEYNTPKSSTGNYKVDVVPYITKITTALSALKNNNPSVYARTAQGHYSVAASETEIKFEGFNLGGDVKFAKEGGSVTVAYNANGIAIPADAKSGNVSIVVAGIESLNNLNGNDSKGSYTGSVDLTANPTGDEDIYAEYYYNRQPNGDNNNLLTDDVVFDIWQINSNVAQAQGSAYITEPIMKINPVSGMLNFAFNSGPGNFTMANGTSTSYTTWLGNLARMTTAAFTVDENGVTHGITVGLDTNPSSGSAGRMQYVTSKWGQALSEARDGNKLGTQGNYEGTQSSRFETIGAPKGTYNGVTYSEYIFMEDRFASPSIVTSIHTEGEGESAVEHTYVFLAYYDDINGQIRFRYGDLNNTTNHTIGRSFGGFQDAWVYGWGKSGDGNHKSFDTNTKSEYFSVIADSGVSGNYLSIDLIKGSTINDDIIVATWQDSTSEKWYYAYKKKPCTDNDLGATVPQGATSNDGYWSEPILLASNAGEDCHISVDPRGGVHIAAYDTDGANLLYAYLANYNDTTAQVVTVDSYAFTGEHLTIDSAISDDGNYVVPLIGYYMGSAKKPKIARLDKVINATDGTGTIPSGVDENDACTGKWETAIIPTDSKYSDNYAYSHVNVAVWKDADGKITNSTRPAQGTQNVDKWIGDNKKVSDETKGYFWGNGTDNPVLGYAIRVGTRGYIETAQMK